MRDVRTIGYRPTWAEINLSNLEYNFRQMRGMVRPQTKVMVTVKADAYGHGLIPVSQRLVACGVDYLGVASIDEGLRLRSARIRVPILILGMILDGDIEPLFRYNLTPTVCTRELAAVLSRKAVALKKPLKVHIKVDTGMGRLGVLHDDALTLIKKIYALPGIAIEGLFTHLAFADLNESFTLHQIDLFNKLLVQLEQNKIMIPLVHSANSMGVLRFKRSHFTMVRPGLVVYGLRPALDTSFPLRLKPVLSLKTRIVYYKRMPQGSGISYGHAYVTKDNTTIAILPIGYGDGYPRILSNKASVLIQGRRFPISGRICMDQIMVDVGNTSVRRGEEVVLIGSQGKETVSAEELAHLSDTIPYEIVCGLGSRIPRVYIT